MYFIKKRFRYVLQVYWLLLFKLVAPFFLVNFMNVVEQQPIGRLLFRKFCETITSYHKCNLFLDALVGSFDLFTFVYHF